MQKQNRTTLNFSGLFVFFVVLNAFYKKKSIRLTHQTGRGTQMLTGETSFRKQFYPSAGLTHDHGGVTVSVAVSLKPYNSAVIIDELPAYMM